MCRFIVPFALALSAFAGSSALAQGSSSGTPSVPNQAPLPVVPTSSPLTLAAAIQIALDGNPEIASSRREVEAMEGARVQAGVFQNPTLSVEVEDCLLYTSPSPRD